MIKFESLPGLPGTGPFPKQFAREGQSTHSEGFVVCFLIDERDEWVGNFQRGLSTYDVVLKHPNDHDVLVVAGGQGYVVDPRTRRLEAVIGAAIINVHKIDDKKLLVLDHQGIYFEAIGSEGSRWHTQRLSWDGFVDVSVDSAKITGKGWGLGDSWCPFEVDLVTGRSTGGGYSFQDSRATERLCDPTAG